MAACAGSGRQSAGAGQESGQHPSRHAVAFPDKAFENLASTLKKILVVEMNHGQMVDDVRLAVNGRVPVHFFGKTGGDMPMYTLAEMTAEVNRLLEE
ncbi:MAG: hypothetical protein ACLSAH_11655 [Bilophila wadsworthia]